MWRLSACSQAAAAHLVAMHMRRNVVYNSDVYICRRHNLKFRMGVREQLRMSAKVTECARAARQVKCLNRPPVCAGIGSVLQPWGGGERPRHILVCLVALFAPIPPPSLVLPPKRRSW